MFQNFLFDYYLIFKSLHVISIICWMVGLLYLPRLFIYHTQVEVTSETSNIFKRMERRLTNAIMTPAMIISFLSGTCLIFADLSIFSQGWLHLKLTLVLIMAALHGVMVAAMKKFQRNQNSCTTLFFRFLNEVPTLLMVLIIFIVITKPF